MSSKYEIKVWPVTRAVQNPFLIAEKPVGEFAEFLVMTSRTISKDGIRLDNGQVNAGLSFGEGVDMDNVMDPRFHTMGRATANAALPLAPRGQAVTIDPLTGKPKNRLANLSDFHDRQAYYRQGDRALSDASRALMNDNSRDNEHQDMGNLTPRILRCINALNTKMGATGDKSALRRVHHNAESHRNRKWGGITETDMNTKKDGDKYGDGFPLTAFHPKRLVSGYFRHQVCTIESLDEFREYAGALKAAGFYVPRNWIWNL